MPSLRPLLIMLTGDVPEALIGYTGNFDTMFLRMADYGSLCIEVRDVAKADMPNAFTEYCGTIVTGSPAMVTDREEWSEKSGKWLREAVLAGHKTLGVCFGHQLMSQALGGTADYHPKGMELGSHPIHLHPEAQNHPLLAGLPHSFDANLVHSQTVTVLPPGAVSLGASEHDPNQVVCYGPNALSLQFHPEFDRETTQRYINLIAGKTRKPLMLGSPAKEAPVAASILQRFITLCQA